ncbi:MAG: DUF2513 domain-containing protein [Gemmatimonadetes bacterium]|nr:DUF2513 domain-containing protein [Gemmatimonadota bacterium]MCY3944633.1 DUF2513 domain-containing protein [Gemmatimonadota bacterium]
MKRDMDLMRKILLAVEARPNPQSFDLVEIPGHQQEEVSYHVKLLGDAGYLDVYDRRALGPDGYRYAPSDLTNAGHDFLDGIRSKSIWEAAKQKLHKIGGTAPLDVVQSLLTSILKEKLLGP